jgi:hypothetical protein
MANFWDTIAGISGDTSVGDTPDLIKDAIKDGIKDGANESDNGWANSPSHDGPSGHNVADKGDWGNSSACNYSR